jgi:endonuclease III
MKTWIFFAAVAMLGLMGACAQPQPITIPQATVKSARTSADHNALAKRYDEAAKQMQAKAQEHKTELEEYVYRSDHYGKRAQDLQAHCRGLIRYYEQAAEANREMAGIHREMAAEGR